MRHAVNIACLAIYKIYIFQPRTTHYDPFFLAFLVRSWERRALYAVQLLEMAQTLSSSGVRSYLTDPRPDNFAVDDHDKVWLVDTENVILVDARSDNLGESLSQHEELIFNQTLIYYSK